MPKTKRQSVDNRLKRNSSLIRELRKNITDNALQLKDSPAIELESYQSFRLKKIIRGSHHQGSERYMFAGIQCTFICLSALMIRLNSNFDKWTTKICDEILADGNKIFEEYIKRTGNRPSMMLIDELPSEISFNGRGYCFSYSTTYTGTISQDLNNEPYYSFYSAIQLAFQESFNCVLIVNNSASVIMKDTDDGFAIFDSHSRDKSGMLESDGTSILIQFNNMEETINYLKILWKSMNLLDYAPFEITAVDLKEVTKNSPQKRKLVSMIQDTCNMETELCQENLNCDVVQTIQSNNSNDISITKHCVRGEEAAILSFKKAVSLGPAYICTCCTQTWFRDSVRCVNRKNKMETQIATKYFIGRKSVDNKEWVCQTCWVNVKKGKMPVCAVQNNNKFPKIPGQLCLTSLEERLISPRIPFMQIRERPRGGQFSIKGNVVNVPSDVTSTVNALPRKLRDSDTIAVKLKRKLSYEHYVYHETIRPSKVFNAVKYLLCNSNLFKKQGIILNEDFLSEESCNEMISFMEGDLESENNEQELAKSSINNGSGEVETESCSKHQCMKSNSEFGDSEVAGNVDTLLHSYDNTIETLILAPGENKTPLSIFMDSESEFLSFPTIYCGHTRPSNKERTVPVHYSDICKWELRNVDRRAAKSVPNLFYKLKKLQIKQIKDKVNTVLRKVKGKKHNDYTAKEILSPGTVDKLVNLNEGYRILRSLRGSPPYYEQMKKDLFALIRQLGLPTFFCSFSAAETKWFPLLKLLGQLIDKKAYTYRDITDMSWIQKCRLIKADPVTCARYFDYRMNKFLRHVLSGDLKPIGKIMDYFGRIEFQHRGSPHLHMLVWIENAPKFGIDDNKTVIQFIDTYITCRKDKDLEELELMSLQQHACSRTCKKQSRNKHGNCRFNFPIPPLKTSQILEPLEVSCSLAVENYRLIQENLMQRQGNDDTEFDAWLLELGLTEKQYIDAVRSTLHEPKPFLKRKVNECRINCYNKTLLCAWEANLDIQYVTNAYACAAYIVSYITKGQRGMSSLLHQACQEVRGGNMDIRQQVRHIGNKFLGAVEVSAQEAAYLVLQLPLRKSSRQVVFINTTAKEERTFLLKSKEQLQQLPDNSTNIESDNLIKRYQRRPKALNNICLADFVSWYSINRETKQNGHYSKTSVENEDDLLPEDDINESNEDDPNNESDFEDNESPVLDSDITKTYEMKGGYTIKRRSKQKVIRYVRFNRDVDLENFCREQIMLFTPWRNEDRLIGKCKSYCERYDQLVTDIEVAKCSYDQCRSLTDTIMSELDRENYEDVAPGTEYQNELDEDEHATTSIFDDVFDPSKTHITHDYDLGPDLGLNVQQISFEPASNLISNEMFYKMVQELNLDQRTFFYHILNHFKTKQKPIYNFLTGGAGCGKSVVTKALYQALVRYFNHEPGENPDEIKVLLCAPTGKASYNINGNTLHSTFHIPVNQSLNYRPLDMQRLNTLRTSFHKLKVVFVDEISMVGNQMFNFIHHRLCDIMGNNLPFGGISIIAIGDLFQLQPVMDEWIFKDLQHNYGPLGSNLWKENFTMFELKEIMRQKDDKSYAELLNRMREGHSSVSDLATLKSRVVSNQHDIPINTCCLYTINKLVDSHNESMIASIEQVNKCCVIALDVVQNTQNANSDYILQKLSNNPAKTMGLLGKLTVALEMRYEISLNVDVSDGLTNGAGFIVKFLDFRHTSISNRLSIVWCLFDDKKVGIVCRKKYSSLYKENIHASWTPVFEVKRNIKVGKNNSFVVIRSQFPFRPAVAKTIHKSQGDTMESLAVHLGNRKLSHIHYVALSRVTNINNLYVLELNESKIAVSNDVKVEMERLRTTSKLELNLPLTPETATTVNICFHNSRSLHKHILDLKSETYIKYVDVLGIAETWLCQSYENQHYSINGFTLERRDNALITQRKPSGIAVYCKSHRQLQNVEFSSNKTNDGEYIIAKCSEYFKIPDLQVVFAYVFPKRNSVTNILNFVSNIESHLHKHMPVVIMGDFNYNLLVNDTLQKTLEHTFAYKQIINVETTDYKSCIDHIYVRGVNNIVASGTLESYYSDHKPIFISISCH